MSLIFDDDRFDRRQFPDLMTNQLRIASGEPLAAASTGFQMQRDHVGTAFDWIQFSHNPPMSGLSTSLPRRLRSGLRNRPGMQMLNRGQQRRTLLRESLDLSFQIIDLCLRLGHLSQQCSTYTRTAGVLSAKISAGISDIRVMHVMSRILPILKRQIQTLGRLPCWARPRSPLW